MVPVQSTNTSDHIFLPSSGTTRWQEALRRRRTHRFRNSVHEVGLTSQVQFSQSRRGDTDFGRPAEESHVVVEHPYHIVVEVLGGLIMAGADALVYRAQVDGLGDLFVVIRQLSLRR